MLSEELKLASPDLDAIERWRAKEAECTRRVAELDGVRGERETVSARSPRWYSRPAPTTSAVGCSRTTLAPIRRTPSHVSLQTSNRDGQTGSLAAGGCWAYDGSFLLHAAWYRGPRS